MNKNIYNYLTVFLLCVFIWCYTSFSSLLRLNFLRFLTLFFNLNIPLCLGCWNIFFFLNVFFFHSLSYILRYFLFSYFVLVGIFFRRFFITFSVNSMRFFDIILWQSSNVRLCKKLWVVVQLPRLCLRFFILFHSHFSFLHLLQFSVQVVFSFIQTCSSDLSFFSSIWKLFQFFSVFSSFFVTMCFHVVFSFNQSVDPQLPFKSHFDISIMFKCI